mmetsp:Transcript_41818/g.134869  ORF Transcript_41818/g.134869 Transcript_41818/m.134869 type:complete len:251 (+) Transcript_41818:106-858(+)
MASHPSSPPCAVFPTSWLHPREQTGGVSRSFSLGLAGILQRVSRPLANMFWSLPLAGAPRARSLLAPLDQPLSHRGRLGCLQVVGDEEVLVLRHRGSRAISRRVRNERVLRRAAAVALHAGLHFAALDQATPPRSFLHRVSVRLSQIELLGRPLRRRNGLEGLGARGVGRLGRGRVRLAVARLSLAGAPLADPLLRRGVERVGQAGRAGAFSPAVALLGLAAAAAAAGLLAVGQVAAVEAAAVARLLLLI